MANVAGEVKRALPRLRDDYAALEGRPFRHFFCPMLLKDEEEGLCMGHVVPQSFPDSCRARVVQRADVDNFYGRVAEADFATLPDLRRRGLQGVISDRSLRRRVQPRIVVNGQECGYYAYKNGQRPRADHS